MSLNCFQNYFNSFINCYLASIYAQVEVSRICPFHICVEIIKRSSTSKYLYRIGGDEFVVIYMKISKEEFEYNVQKMKNNFMSSQCRVAIGVQWTKDSQDIQNIIKRADELMYSNKQEYYSTHKTTGRYRHDKTLQYLSNPDILDLKISQGQFHVYLQAKIDVKSCELVGADALIKYKDDSQFIHIISYKE